MPITSGDLRPALVTVTALDHSGPPKPANEELDSEKAAVVSSLVTDLSAEKVAAKMIERKVKVSSSVKLKWLFNQMYFIDELLFVEAYS